MVGPSGIQIGSETLKSATTMTADGVTVTYDGPEEETATSSGATTSGATTSGAAATATASSSSMAWAGYITINDQTYHIPSDDSSLDIVLDDGSLLTLSSGQVSINGDKVDIPDNVSDSPTLTADGQSFTVGEGFDGNGGDGGGGDGGSGGSGGGGGGSGISSLIDTLSGLGDAESSLSSSLDKITSGIKSWASGGSEASSLSGSIDSALENLNQVLSPMRSISQSTELQELTTDGLRVVSNAYPELERGRDILSSMQKLLKGLPTLRDAATQNVKKYWLRYVATGGGLLALDQSIQKLKDYSWDDALVATKTATSTTATATSGTSTTSTGSPTASSYFITTKRGTSLTKFKAFVHGLDGGAGTQIAYSEVDHQGYVTDLTVAQLATVKALPFIRTVSYNIPVTELEDDEDFRAVPNRAFSPEFDELHDVTNHKSSKLLSPRAIAQSPRSNSGSHLKMISSDKTGKPTEDYLFDDTLGKGTTIYVIDTGYDLSKPVSVLTQKEMKRRREMLILNFL